MPVPGQSNAGGLAVVTETDYGVLPESPSWSGIPILQEGVNSERPTLTDNQIYGSREVQQETPLLEEDGGNFQHRANPGILPLLLLYLFGNISSGAVAGSITAAPTVTPQSGGSLAPGAYRYVTAAILQRTADGKKFYTNPSAEASGTAGSGNLQNQVQWVAPTVPSGFTQYGTGVFASPAGGAADTKRLKKVVTGTGTSWVDDGSETLTTIPPPDPVYQHAFTVQTSTPGVHPLKSFSLVKRVDIAESELFTGCYVDKLTINAPGTNEAIECQWEIKARKAETIANPSLAPAVVPPLMGFQALVLLDGVATPQVKSFQVELSNGLSPLEGFTGEPFYRNFLAQLLMPTGNLELSFESHSVWNKMRAGTTFAFLAWVAGDPTTQASATTTPATITAWPYGMTIDLPKANYQKAGGNLNQAEALTEQPDFKASRDLTKGYSVKIVVYNKTASYA